MVLSGIAIGRNFPHAREQIRESYAMGPREDLSKTMSNQKKTKDVQTKNQELREKPAGGKSDNWSFEFEGTWPGS